MSNTSPTLISLATILTIYVGAMSNLSTSIVSFMVRITNPGRLRPWIWPIETTATCNAIIISKVGYDVS